MKKILYIIDDINYNSGAKKVTLYQMKEMQKRYDVYLLSLVKPKETIDFLKTDHILCADIWKKSAIYAISFKKVMREQNFSILEKLSRLFYSILLRCGMGDTYFERKVYTSLRNIMENFDDVIVMSEASKLRRLVSTLERPRKIQWIHTDYARWSEFSEWSKAITKNDSLIYAGYDTLVALSDYCKVGIIQKIPSIADKIVIIPNMVDGDTILHLSKVKCNVEIENKCLNFVTVARIDKEKRIDKLLWIAKQMKENGVRFRWYVIGDGPQKSELDRKNRELKLENEVRFLGHLDNPYSVMAKCDALVLLSKYEGTPVTIDEAMVLGIAIIAPAIGGIPEQVKNYDLCYLIKNDEFEILNDVAFKEVGEKKFDYKEYNAYICSLIETIL